MKEQRGRRGIFMRITKGLVLAVMAASMTACGNAAEELGLGRNPPDEFAVVDRPPLSMPPDFDLRPPQPGATRPQEVSMNERASETVFGLSPKEARGTDGVETSDSEKELLAKAGAASAQTGIRETVDREATQKVSGSSRLVESLLWWREKEAGATTVDAVAEADRLKSAKEKGDSVNAGATPVIEKGKGGWLGL